MPEATGLMAHNWGFAIFLLGVVGLCAFMLGVSSLLGSKAWGRSKNEPFESGMLPTGGARLRLSAKFYLVAMLFVIRSEEHTSELQSLMRISYAVFCLKQKTHTIQTTILRTHTHY